MNTENGWSKIRNDIHDDPLLNKDSEYLSVWIYLLTHQAYGEYKAMFSGKVITLKEGQLLTSRAKIARATGISDSKIKRILNSLKIDQRIDQQTDRQQSLITLISLNDFDQRNDQQSDQRLTNDRPTIQETENEKEKSSKREKDKEKEINKTIKKDKNIYPSISPHGETGRDDFSYPSGKSPFSSDKEAIHIPKTEEDLDRWLEEDDGIDEWDKVQIYYRNLNSRQQLAGSSQQDSYTEDNEADSFAPTNPIQRKKKEININSPQPPSCEANPQPQIGHAPVPRIFGEANHGDTPPSPVTEMFEEFWKAYPKKVGKGYAQECFKKIRVSRKLLDTMLEAIAKQKKSDMWKRDKGQYIPNPSTWLNQKRWEDDLGGETDSNPWSSFKLGIEL